MSARLTRDAGFNWPGALLWPCSAFFCTCTGCHLGPSDLLLMPCRPSCLHRESVLVWPLRVRTSQSFSGPSLVHHISRKAQTITGTVVQRLSSALLPGQMPRPLCVSRLTCSLVLSVWWVCICRPLIESSRDKTCPFAHIKTSAFI